MQENQTWTKYSLLIYNIQDTKVSLIDPQKLEQNGWPSAEVKKAAYHSPYLILLTSDKLHCFQLKPTESDIQCISTSAVAFVSALDTCKDFVCYSTYHKEEGSLRVLDRMALEPLGLLSIPHHITDIVIRGTLIIAVASGGRSIECWNFDISKDRACSLSHLKSVDTGNQGRRISTLGSKLSVGYDPEHYILSGCVPGMIISKDKDIYDMIGGHDLIMVDGIAQFLATCHVEESIATIVIFDAVLFNEVTRVRVRIPIEVGVFLSCRLLFGLILIIFTRGIMKIRPIGVGYDLIQEIAWDNSGSTWV